ncbi:MAG TPA: S4 domain-containing protein, partial [Candidatus Deferrimicrobium sp.]|nr:S4 domain-containing protein [Candidatus Deferrimicrobium sp.]
MGLARFTVGVETAGMRLDVFVARHYAAPATAEAMSRAGVQKLIDAGQVTVNGARMKSSVRVKLADRIEIHIPAVREIGLIAEDLPLTILYEDLDIIVIHKAAGMVVHPAAGRTSGT